jgi:hypothetical protein
MNGAAVQPKSGDIKRLLLALVFLLPLANLAWRLIAWVANGYDLPVLDDWRPYIRGNATSLSLSYLFFGENDSLSVTGRISDVFMTKLLGGNGIASQFLSTFLIFGGVLLLQWRFLCNSIESQLLRVSAFILLLFWMQPGTAGIQNVMYHVYLTILFTFLALYIVFYVRNLGLQFFLTACLGVLSGLSYISGAFATLAVGSVLLICSRYFLASDRSRLLSGGAALAITGLCTALPQLYFTFVAPGTGHHSPVTLPFNWDYWLFIVGKVGRALNFPLSHPFQGFICSMVVILFLVGIAALVFWRISRGGMTLRSATLGIVFLSVSAMSLAFLLLVAAGRTRLGIPDDHTWLQMFQHGYNREYFIWITPLFPAALAALYSLLSESRRARFGRALGMAVILVVLPYSAYAGVWRHKEYFMETTSEFRLSKLQCIKTAKCFDDFPFSCIGERPGKMSQVMDYAKGIGQTFTRSFTNEVCGPRSSSSVVLFNISGTSALLSLKTYDLDVVNTTPTGVRFVGKRDPMILVLPPMGNNMGIPVDTRKCYALSVALNIRVSEADIAQVFYKSPAAHEHSAAESSSLFLQPNAEQLVEFNIVTPHGFDGLIRIDPVTKPQEIELLSIEGKCWIPASG